MALAVREHREVGESGSQGVRGGGPTGVTVSDEEWTAGMVNHGVPESGATMVLGMFVAARRGDLAAVDPTLEKLLDRRPTTFRDVLAG